METLLSHFQEISDPVHGFEFRVDGANLRVLSSGAQKDAHQALCELSERLRVELHTRPLVAAVEVPASNVVTPRSPATSRSILDRLFRRGISNEPLAPSEKLKADPTQSVLPPPTLEELRARRFIPLPPSARGPAPRSRFKHQPAIPGLNYVAPRSVLPPGISRIRVTDREITVSFLGSSPMSFPADEPSLKELLARIIPSAPVKPAMKQKAEILVVKRSNGDWSLSNEAKKAAKQAILEQEASLLESLSIDPKTTPCSFTVAGVPGKGSVSFVATATPNDTLSKVRKVKATLAISGTGLTPAETTTVEEDGVEVVPAFTEAIARICNEAMTPKVSPQVRSTAPKIPSIGPMEKLVTYQNELIGKREKLDEKRDALALEKNAIGLKAILLTKVTETDSPTLAESARVWPSMDKHVVQLDDARFTVTAQRDSGYVEGQTTDEKLIHDAQVHLKRCADLESERSMVAHGLARRREWVQEQKAKKQARATEELSTCNPSTAEFGLVLAREIGMEPTAADAFAKVADHGRVISYEDDSGVSVEVYFDGKTAVRSISNVPGDVKYEKTTSGDWIKYLTQYFSDVDQQCSKNPFPAKVVEKSDTAYSDYEKALAAFEKTKDEPSAAGEQTRVTLESVTQWVMENGLFAPIAGLPEETRRMVEEARRAWKHIGTGATLANGPKDVEEVPAKVYFNGRMFVAHAAHGGEEFVALGSNDEMGALATEALAREALSSGQKTQLAERAAKELEIATTRLSDRKAELFRELTDREYSQSDKLSWRAMSLAQAVVEIEPSGEVPTTRDEEFAKIADHGRILASVEDRKTGKTVHVHFNGKLFGVETSGENPIGRVVDTEELVAGAREYFELVEKDRPVAVPAQEPVRTEPAQSEELVPDGVTRHQARLREGGPTSRGDCMDILDSNGKHLSTISGEGIRWVELTDDLRQGGAVQVTIEKDEVTKGIHVRQITVPAKGTRNLDPTPDEDRPPINDAEIDNQMGGDVDASGLDDFELDR